MFVEVFNIPKEVLWKEKLKNLKKPESSFLMEIMYSYKWLLLIT